jgi:hypothetical protein
MYPFDHKLILLWPSPQPIGLQWLPYTRHVSIQVLTLLPLPMIVSVPTVPVRAAQTEITAKAKDNRSMVAER